MPVSAEFASVVNQCESVLKSSTSSCNERAAALQSVVELVNHAAHTQQKTYRSGPEWNELIRLEELSGDLMVCSVWTCGVRPRCNFMSNGKSTNRGRHGLYTRCKACNLPEAREEERLRVEKRKREYADALMSRPDVGDQSSVEVRFAAWISYELSSMGFEIEYMPEFRHADMLVRRADWEQYVRLQLKSDGHLKRSGELKTAKDHGQYSNALAYKGDDRMLVVFGRLRKKTHDDPDTYTIWAIDGELTLRDHPTAAKDGTLEGYSPITPAQLAAAIDDAFADVDFPKSTLHAALLDIKAAKQRTEVKLMLAYEQVTGNRLVFPRGNQTQIDAIDNTGRKLQFKTFKLCSRTVDVSTRDNGKTKAYWEDAPFDALVVGVIVSKPDGWYLLHCEFSKATLLDHGILRRRATETTEATLGCMSLSPPLDEHAEWLFGARFASKSRNLWMRGCWRGPTRLAMTERMPESFLLS